MIPTPPPAPTAIPRRRAAVAALGAMGLSLAFFVGLLIFTALHAPAMTNDPPVSIQTATEAINAPTATRHTTLSINSATATAAAKGVATATATPQNSGGGPLPTTAPVATATSKPTPHPTPKPTASPKPVPTATRHPNE